MSDWTSPLYLAFLHPINLTESGTVEFPFPHLLSKYIQYWYEAFYSLLSIHRDVFWCMWVMRIRETHKTPAIRYIYVLL